MSERKCWEGWGNKFSRLFPHLWNSHISTLTWYEKGYLFYLSYFSSLPAVLCTFTHLPSPPSLTAPFIASPAPAPSTHLTYFHYFISSSHLSHFLSLQLSQQTFSDSLSCKLGCLSSLISKQVSLPRCLLHLPIQPTLGLNRACSLCVKNKSSSAHFRVKWDYLATAFISFLPPFLVPHS